MARLSISLLGTFLVFLDGEPVTAFEYDKARALLAYLAVESDRPHRRGQLAGLLWPERPERNARHNLSQALLNLRRAIGDRDATPSFLIVTPQTLQFNSSSDHWLDVAAFTGLLTACEEHRHRRLEACDPCVERLQQAVALYRGNFLAGFSLGDSPAFEEWSLLEQERLHRLVLEALRRLTGCHEQRGEYEQALQHARRWVELDPWREEAHRQLMRALALSGRRGAALAQYEICRRTLVEELGVEPEKETTALCARIRDGADLHPHTPILPYSHTPTLPPPHNLPAPLTPFVGRETELAEIKDRLQNPDCRLLTLVGPGGSGKTRLALEAAATQVHHFAHGVFLVSLAPLDSVEAIVPTVAHALNFSFHGEGDPRQHLLNYLRQKSMLLIMDNFEHLLACPEPACPERSRRSRRDGVGLVTDILEMSPDVTVLATSRARLNVQGEHLFPIAGMDLPPLPSPTSPPKLALSKVEGLGGTGGGRRGVGGEGQYSAVELFVTSARRAQPNFALTAGNLTDAVRICHLVQGMPLGILLAAAWVGMLTLAEIATEIDQSLNFLEMDWRDVPARQRSMRAVFDHSWSLLTERERELFQGLSVFRGGFTRQAAQQVTGASLRELMTLVDKSLLHRTHKGMGRYEAHELLRQYAAEKLDQTPAASEAARDQHCAYYAAALQQWDADSKGSRQQAALAEIEADSENARAAWNWAVEQGQVTRAVQF